MSNPETRETVAIDELEQVGLVFYRDGVYDFFVTVEEVRSHMPFATPPNVEGEPVFRLPGKQAT